MTDVVTPSSVWQGTPSRCSRWTVEQLLELKRAGVTDPENVAVALIERRAHANITDWTMPPQVERLALPRLALTRDRRRAKVITPAGALRWIEVQRG